MTAQSDGKIFTFSGRDMEEATAKIKEKFGDNAELVAVRHAPKSPLFRLGGKSESLVEIDVRSANSPSSKPVANTLISKVYSTPNQPKPKTSTPDLFDNYPPIRVVSSSNENFHSENSHHSGGMTFADLRATAAQTHRPIAPSPQPENPPPPSPELLAQMQQMIQATLEKSLEKGINHLGGIVAGGNAPMVGERYFEIYRRMVDNEVDSAIAKETAEKLQFNLGVNPQLSDELVTETLIRFLSGEFRTMPNLATMPPPNNQPAVLALVGPSGSGKTTTAAKLAFDAGVTHQRNVALITEDLHRPGAETQLRAMTGMLGFPTVGADTPAKIAEEIQNFALEGVRMVIIDTAGRAIRDQQGIADLTENLRAAAPVEIHLVIPATMSEKAALGYAESYRPCDYNRLLISKVDEAINFGLLLNLARKLPVPFSSLATGGHSFRNALTFATPEILARLIAYNRF